MVGVAVVFWVAVVVGVAVVFWVAVVVAVVVGVVVAVGRNEMTRDDIERMAREAGMSGLESSGIIENFERFAELIVRECLHSMENCDGDLDFAIWKTKKHFGVE